MTVTIGQPNDCNCGAATSTSSHTSGCSSPGCSIGTNLACYDGSYATPPPAHYTPYGVDRDPPPGAVIGHSRIDTYFGCNCPGEYYNTTNAYYYFYDDHTGTIAIYAVDYNYETCTDFGGNTHDIYGNIHDDRNAATDCCNFCCNRTDPHPSLPTPPPPPPTTPSSVGRAIQLDNLLYLSSLIILVRIVFKIN